MGISRLSAITIQTNEIRCEAKGPYENGKFGMTTLLIRDGNVHREVISCDYGYYESEEIAVKAAEDLVKELRDLGDKIWDKDATEKEEDNDDVS
jgi:hypothetical protein